MVVGLGAAGAAAAIAAAEAGAETLVLERQMAGGGTSALSGGLIYLGGGTPVQEACGFEDDADNMEAFLVHACGPNADVPKVHAYCQESVAHFHWFTEHGVPFKAEFYPEPSREPPTDAGLIYCGGELAWPNSEIARPAPRGHHPQFPDTAGGFLMERLIEAVGRTSAEVTTEARAERLVVDSDGRVVGVSCSRDGSDHTVRARGGVVLAGGGFVFNNDMVEHYCPVLLGPASPWRLGTDADDGRAIRMGQGVGAGVAGMSTVECALPLTIPQKMAKGILVDSSGRRFVNEDSYIGHLGQSALLGRGGEVYYVTDESKFEVNFVGMQVNWVAETVGELAEDMGLPPDVLANTVAEYNRHALSGDDPEFHKRAEFVEPLEPLFGAVDLRATSGTIYATFTLGGLRTDERSRVLDCGGHPIPGLFAAGRCTAGISMGGYVSGISLGDGTFFGRRAGAGAAALGS